MLIFQQTQSHTNLAVILQLFGLTLVSIIPLMVMGYVTGELHSRFEGVDIFQECHWYTFPAKIRRVLPIIICGSRKMDFFKVFGNIAASRETCKQVIRIHPRKLNGKWLQLIFFIIQGVSKCILNLHDSSPIFKIDSFKNDWFIIWCITNLSKTNFTRPKRASQRFLPTKKRFSHQILAYSTYYTEIWEFDLWNKVSQLCAIN